MDQTERVKRMIAEVTAQVFDEIAAEDGLTAKQRKNARGLILAGILGKPMMPLTPNELAYAALSDDEMRARMRVQIEPVIREALAPLRPS